MRTTIISALAFCGLIALTGCEELDGLLVSFESEYGEEGEEGEEFEDSGWEDCEDEDGEEDCDWDDEDEDEGEEDEDEDED
jgi:hypothetical protein